MSPVDGMKGRLSLWKMKQNYFETEINCLAKTWFYLTLFVCADRIFDSPPFMKNKIFLKKTAIKVGSWHLYVSFGTFCVQFGQLFESQWDLKLSEEFESDVIFLQKQRFYRFQAFFKDSLCLQKLTNLDAKGAKRSVKMWAINFYQSFFTNILF